MQVTLDYTEEAAANIRTFWFKADHKIRYAAGQFIEITLPHQPADGRGQKRWFTLSSSPTEDLLSITTKHATDHVSSFKQTLFGLKPGATVTISEPMGDFVLPKDTSLPLVFVAGGIGVTPMRSMIKYLSDTGEQRQVSVLYAARTLDEVAFADMFKKYGIKLEIVLSEPIPGWTGLTGPVSAEMIVEFAGNNPKNLIYVSGPEPMVESLEKTLKKLGVSSQKLVLDFFPNYSSTL